MVLKLLTSRRGIIAAVAYILYAIVCTQLALLNTLGYEFSALTGIVVVIISAPLLTDEIKSRARHVSLVSFFLRVTYAHLLLLLIPFVVLLINANFVRNCSILSGAGFFLLIPVVTAVFCSALLMFLTEFFKKYYSVVYCLIIVLLLFHPFLTIYSQPQLYAYNHLFGMFIGFSWDESQPPFATLALYRITTLAYASLLLAVTSVLSFRGKYFLAGRQKKRAVVVATFFSLIIIVSGLFFSDELGFNTSASFTRRTLGSSVHSKNFDVYYAEDSFTKDEIQFLLEEHEFRLAQVIRELDVQWSARITSYIYPSREVKKRLLGSETSQIARPWMREIHLSKDGWENSLKHELVHVVAGSFAPYIVKAPFVHFYGLTEGLAMAVEWEYGNRTPHQYAAAMRAYNLLPPVDTFITTSGFMNHASSLSYVASGSFCKWLIEEYGVEKMKRAYASDDLIKAFGIGIDSLQKKWWRYLDVRERMKPDSLAVMYLFTGIPIFKKVCARVLTEIHREAFDARREYRFGEAFSLYQRSEELSPNTTAVFGMVYSLYQLGKYDSVLSITERYFRDEKRSRSLLPLYLVRGDAAWCTGDSAEADRSYSLLVRERITASLTNEACDRLEILHDVRSRQRTWNVIHQRMDRDTHKDSVRLHAIRDLENVLRLDSGLSAARIMLARYLSPDFSRIGRAIQLLVVDSERPELLYRTKIFRGELLYQTGQIEKAQQEFESLLQSTLTETVRRDVIDHIEKCRWKRGMFR